MKGLATGVWGIFISRFAKSAVVASLSIFCAASGSDLAKAPVADSAEKRQWKKMEDWISAGKDPKQTQADGTTALHWAVLHDQLAAVETLLAAGVDCRAQNRYGATPLILACTNGSSKAVAALLAAGADPNTSTKGGETALITAARTGRIGPVNALLEKGADPKRSDSLGQTALMWAAAEGHSEVVERLIHAGCDPGRAMKSGFTPLLFAARNGRAGAAKKLIAAGVDLEYAISDSKGGRAPPRGATALRLAVENAHFELAIDLLAAGANPNDQRSGFAPLHVLAWVRKPNRGDGEDGAPPPRGSGKISSLEFANRLVSEFGADVNLRLKRGSSGSHRFGFAGATPFLMAARTADLAYLNLLYSLGADPKVVNRDGVSALLAAAGLGCHAPTEEAGTEEECLAAVKWLLDLGLEIDHRSRRGDSAMHGAAFKSLPQMVRFLDENGADAAFWRRKNRAGRTPLTIARGYRPGNFKPAPAVAAALEEIMRKNGMEIPLDPRKEK